MACIHALSFCIAHRGCNDESLLIRELSSVQNQVTKGLKYFTELSSSVTTGLVDVKEPVRRFITKLSSLLNLPEDICHELLVHFLATNNDHDDGKIQSLIMNGRVNDLLSRVQFYYWQERLALCGLLRLSMCNWHEAWYSIADVLFAMTNVKTRTELIETVLSDYADLAATLENFIKDRKYDVSNIFDSTDQFDTVLSLRLKEQLEMLNVILLGIHASPFMVDASAVQFTKFLETFWSHSFGLDQPFSQALSKHRVLLDKICFTQTLILIRTAHLDYSHLYPDLPQHENHNGIGSNLRSASSVQSTCRTGVNDIHHVQHFLSDSHLLNRLLVSLSELGDQRVHGPLLLFGAVCASAFGSTTNTPATSNLDHGRPRCGSRGAIGHGDAARSETANLVAGQYGHLAVESLKVFHFLADQLDGIQGTAPETNSPNVYTTDSDSALCEADLGLIDFCSQVATFDLLALLTRDVVLWSLDSTPPSFDLAPEGVLGNRAACIHIVARTLRTIAKHAQLASRGSDDALDSAIGPGLGHRLAGLVESLAEVFPHDLSLLRLCIALMAPLEATDAEQTDSRCLVNLVSELVSNLPYLAQPLTGILSTHLARITTRMSSSMRASTRTDSCGPLSSASTNQLLLTRPYMVCGERLRVGGGDDDEDQLQIDRPIDLPVGTRAVVASDLGLIIWKCDYSIWSVIGHELRLCASLVNQATQTGSLTTDLDQSLYTQFGRLHQFVQFANACVQARVHITPCLSIMSRLWPLMVQSLHLARSASNVSSVSPAPAGQLNRLLRGHLLPLALHSLSAALTHLASTDDTQLFSDHARLWDQVLCNANGVFPNVMRPPPGVANDVAYVYASLTSIFSRFVLSSLAKSPIMDDLSNIEENSLSKVYAFRDERCVLLLTAYLNFTSGLLVFTKWLFMSELSHLLQPCVELLSGALHLVITCLLPRLSGRLDEWYERRRIRGSGPSVLAEQCLILLTDLLTTRGTSDEELFANDQTPAGSDHGMPTFCEPSAPSYSTGVFGNPLDGLRKVAFRLLIQHPSALQCLLQLSSIPLSMLLNQFQASEQGFALSISNKSTLSATSFGGRMVRIVWLTLTLIHRLLVLEHTAAAGVKRAGVVERSSSETDIMPLVSALLDCIEPTTREHYISILFQYLDYPYNVGLARTAVSVLKWLVQYSNASLIQCLAPHSASRVREICLRRLASSSEDQLTRGSLFDLMAEVILCADSSTGSVASLRARGHGFLRLLTSELPRPRSAVVVASKDDFWLGSGLLSESEEGKTKRLGLLECCVMVLGSAKKSSSNTPPPNELSTFLLVSVMKLIAALYLQDLRDLIQLLQSEPNFWELLTHPLHTILGFANMDKTLSTSLQHELCGHIVSILGLELFHNLGSQTSGCSASADLHRALKQLIERDACISWFRLLTRHLYSIEARVHNSPDCDNHSSTSDNTQLSNLHDTVCRWKCLMVVHSRYRQSIGSEEEPVPPLVAEFAPLIDSLLESLKVLNQVSQLPGTLELAAQLGALLTSLLSQQLTTPPLQSPTPSDTTRGMTQLTDLTALLIHWHPGSTEQSHHVHSELLASASLMLRALHGDVTAAAVKSSASSEVDCTRDLKVDLADCAFGYVAQLASYMQLSMADEAALRQAISLLTQLWEETCQPGVLAERMAQTGVLNNLLNTLEQYTKLRNGAVLAHDIFALLIRLIITTNQSADVAFPTRKTTLYPNLNAAGLSVDAASGSNRMSAPSTTERKSASNVTDVRLLTPYANVLSSALQWPPAENLIQWICEDMSASAVPVYCETVDKYQTSGYASHSTGWCRLIHAQLSLLCWLHDMLGGSHHPLVAELMHTVCVRNAPQMDALFHLWTEPFSGATPSRRSVVANQLLACTSAASLLHHGGPVWPSRVHLAEAVCSVWWRAMVAGQALGINAITSGSGLPTVGVNVLFRSSLTGAAMGEEEERFMRYGSPFLPTYGPPLEPALVLACFQSVAAQVHLCSVLLQRPGLQLGPRVMGSNTTPVKAGLRDQQQTPPPPASVQSARGRTPPSRRTKLAGSTTTTTGGANLQTQVSIDYATGQYECSGLWELICLVQHLVGCLAVLLTQLPSLGYLSLLSSEELHELHTPIGLSFNTPNLHDHLRQLTFGVLLSLIQSVEHLLSKLSSQGKPTHLNEAGVTQAEPRLILRSLLVEAHEMTLALLFSQATLVLASVSTPPNDKQLLVRELAGELKSSATFGRSSRRTQSWSHRSSAAPSSLSPGESRSSIGFGQRGQRETSPYPVTNATRRFYHFGGTKLGGEFGFDQAVEQFTDLLRLSL